MKMLVATPSGVAISFLTVKRPHLPWCGLWLMYGSALAGINKGAEEERRTVFFHQLLRMPLHGPNESLLGIVNGFDDSILAATHHGKAGGNILDGLMVETVHCDHIPSDQVVKRGVGRENTVVAGTLCAGCHAMVYFTGGLGGDVLVQAAAKVDIHHLQTSADAQNRLFLLLCQTEEQGFTVIPIGCGCHSVIPLFLTVQCRFDVPAAGEQNAVALACQIG